MAEEESWKEFGNMLARKDKSQGILYGGIMLISTLGFLGFGAAIMLANRDSGTREYRSEYKKLHETTEVIADSDGIRILEN